MTTDTVPKTCTVQGSGYLIGGMAKGAAMLAPALATMLVVLTTDADLSATELDKALRGSVRTTFDRLDSDGCMSTNDTVLLLASGASGVRPDPAEFTELLTAACDDLARQLLLDAEGATKAIAIEVIRRGQRGRRARRRPGDRAGATCSSARSAGEDPNWGRVLSAVGTTSAVFEPDELSRRDQRSLGVQERGAGGRQVGRGPAAEGRDGNGRPFRGAGDRHRADYRPDRGLRAREFGVLDVIAEQTHASALAKAATLIEALPWLERFHGQVVVIKYGGHAMTDEALRMAFAQDVVFLRYAGLRPVVVHGGGPQISAHLDRLGMESTFRAGLRVTTPEAMDVVRMVLTGQVNRDVVGLINRHGPFAVGMSGEDAHLLTAPPGGGDHRRRRGRRHRARRRGRVGQSRSGQRADRRRQDPGDLDRGPQRRRRGTQRQRRHGRGGAGGGARRRQARDADRRGRPVRELAGEPGRGGGGRWHDGGVGGRGGLPPQVISELTVSELAAMLPGLSDGMIPKMEACLTAVRGGVPQAHVLDGRLPHAVLLEIFTDSGIGTMVVPDGEQRAA